jgi:hypothetical protein
VSNAQFIFPLTGFCSTYFIEVLRRIVVGVEVAVALAILRISIRGRTRPLVSFATRVVTSIVGTLTDIKSFWLSKHIFHIAGPRNARFLHKERLTSVGRHTRGEGEDVVEQRVGDETTWVQFYVAQVIERVTVL